MPKKIVKSKKRDLENAEFSPKKKMKLKESDDESNKSNDESNEETNENETTIETTSKQIKNEQDIDDSWDSLDVMPNTKRAIDSLGFEKMMAIQAKAIPILLNGSDLAGAARTGSGKTLAFIIPMVDILAREEWTTDDGTGGIVIAPTRELAIQTKGVASQMVKYHKKLRVGLTIGGSSRSAEAQMLKFGCAIICSTPGRLMDHLESTLFKYSKLKMLCIDEADMILDIGFEHQMHSILNALPEDRQTLLFSATLTEKTKDLITMAFRSKPAFVSAGGGQTHGSDKLQQMYSVVPQDKKLPSLLTWLNQHKNLKVLLFFSTKKGVRFYESLFQTIGIKCLALYGAMEQTRRTATFFDFVKAESGILLATNIASRGLDFPAVHWIVQFDPPQNPKEYIHRIGRTARAELSGKALVFLQPSEMEYLDLLRDCDLSLEEVEINDVGYDELQTKVEKVVGSDHYLSQLAADAFRAFVRSYDQRAHSVFNNSGINQEHAAKSFGLDEIPSYVWGNRSFGGNGDFRNRDGRRGRGRGRGRGSRRGRNNFGDRW